MFKTRMPKMWAQFEKVFMENNAVKNSQNIFQNTKKTID